jgi:hypothetical protein
MFSAPHDRFAARLLCIALAGMLGTVQVHAAQVHAAIDRPLDAQSIMRAAEAYRGLAQPYRFFARISKRSVADVRDAPDDTLVEIRSDGFARQLIFVMRPSRGDVLLRTGDVTWLRPRRLHRLTRIPPDLRMFNGAAISDVTSVDLLKSYVATVRSESCVGTDDYVLDLSAIADHVRYPRAMYRVQCDTLRPERIEFMAGSGKGLKTVAYEEFAPILGSTIATRLIVEDHIFRDITIVDMNEFQLLTVHELDAFSPERVLALPDVY